MIYKIFETIYLNEYEKCYHKVLAINNIPSEEKIKKYIKHVGKQKLSIFHDFYCCKSSPHCLLLIKNPKKDYEYLTVDQLDILLELFLENGYKIDKNLTKVFQDIDKNVVLIITK